LVGITPITITQDMVGKTIGVFTAIEVKTPKGKPTEEQINFIQRVRDLGGFAGVAQSVEDALEITNQ
jgi:type IV secretory pathway TrbF-like protein